jgi:acyl-CoA synthetase (AMP-forming)/AMP-acid ligase II
MSTPVPFSEGLAAGLAGYGGRRFIEFERTWYTGDDITHYRSLVERALADGGVSTGEPVGVVVRNRLPHAAALLGFIADARPVVMIYSYQSATAIAADVERLQLAAVVADTQDWTGPAIEAARRAGSAAVSLSATSVGVLANRTRAQSDPALAQAGIHILTSGTTGAPKRIPIRSEVLAHTVASMVHGHVPSPDDPPDLVFWPFGSIGVCQLLAAPYVGKSMVLLEKFSVAEWVRAVATYRLRRTAVQPAIVRMLLDSDVTRDDVPSLECVVGGSGPLESEVRLEFERRFGIPVLWAYGATEFAGSICAWTPDLRARFGDSKSDSSGRALPGVGVRIVDADTGHEVPTGSIGLLEARVDVMGPDWLRTTDLASVDEDGFITLHGRSDGAINRGGFKILPESVRRVLIGHPAVLDACVVAVPDSRLGEVPFAAVELRRDATPPTEAELSDLVRERLPSHHVPVAITIADALPRNAAMKVRPSEVAAWYRPPDRR